MRVWLGYFGMLFAALAAYLLIRHVGIGLQPEHLVSSVGSGTGDHTSTLAKVLIALATITLATRGTGWVLNKTLKQPPVIGEILAGLMLGPSLLGALAPSVSEFLLPSDIAPTIGMISKIGVILFMFLVGLEVDLQSLRENSRSTLTIAHASIVAPFLCGGVLSMVLYPIYAPQGVDFTSFSLFIGVSLSVTAFPVLARILGDRKLQHTKVGMLALACAAIGDATAWTLLAAVSAIASSQIAGLWMKIGMVLAYLAAMIGLVRPVAVWFGNRSDGRSGPLSRTSLAGALLGALISALATEAIGIHALFGAFLLGTLIPSESRLSREIRLRSEDLILVLFLPAFFAFTGMRTEIGQVSTFADVAFCVLIIGVATIGKFGGTYVSARLTGQGQRAAAALGVLMNTRGLMELIVLNVGLDMGILSPKLFTMLVIMALVTTFLTTPVLQLLGPRGFAEDPETLPNGSRT